MTLPNYTRTHITKARNGDYSVTIKTGGCTVKCRRNIPSLGQAREIAERFMQEINNDRGTK